MKKYNKFYVILLMLVPIALILYYLMQDEKHYKWYESYKDTSKEPYGCYIVTELLKAHFPGKDFISLKGPLYKMLSADSSLANSGHANYILVGENMFLNKEDSVALLKFVDAGNDAFIASKDLPEELTAAFYVDSVDSYEDYIETDSIEIEEDSLEVGLNDTLIYDGLTKSDSISYSDSLAFNYSDSLPTSDSSLTALDSLFDLSPYTNPSRIYKKVDDSVATFNFNHPQLKSKTGYRYKFYEKDKARVYKWFYIDSLLYSKLPSPVNIGYMNEGQTNFVKLKYGRGNFYFCTNPIVFTNYYLLNEPGKEYASKMFSHLKPGKIYWDEFSKIPMTKTGPDTNPLKYILSEPALRWAWYLMLLVVLVFLIFFTKRKQRIIPVLPVETNTSIQFTETIGRLYFQQHNHEKLAEQIMKLFLEFIRTKYYLSTNKISDDLINKIAVKSQVQPSEVRSIFDQFGVLKYSQGTSAVLLKFYRIIEHFYKNCK